MMIKNYSFLKINLIIFTIFILLFNSGCFLQNEVDESLIEAEKFIDKGDFYKNKVEGIFIILPSSIKNGFVEQKVFEKKKEEYNKNLNSARENYEKALAELASISNDSLPDEQLEFKDKLEDLINLKIEEINGYSSYIEEYGDLLSILSLINNANEAYNSSKEKITLIIENLNSQQYFEAKTQVLEAKTKLKEAENQYRQINEINLGVGAGDALNAIAKSEIFLNNSIRIADAGLRKDSTTYNSLIAQNKSMQEEIEKAEDKISDPIKNPKKWLESSTKLQDIFTEVTKESYQVREEEKKVERIKKSIMPWWQRILN